MSCRHFTNISTATSVCINKKYKAIFEMGSKKLKRKKVKILKLDKYHKLKKIKRKKSSLFDSHKKTDCNEKQFDKNIDHRSSQQIYSRSYVGGKDISDVKYFCKIREDYFSHLQVIVSENCVFYDSLVSEEILENLVLELEQKALLACLQVDIYKKSMLKIIKDIKKSSEEKQVHKDVRKLLPYSLGDITDQVNVIKSASTLPEIEMYNRIPTIANSRSDDNLENNENFWMEQPNFNSDSYYLVMNNCQETFSENQNEMQNSSYTYSWSENETYSLSNNLSNYWNNEVMQKNEGLVDNLKNTIISQSLTAGSNPSNSGNKILFSGLKQSEKGQESIDHLLVSRNQLQKSVEQSLKESEKITKQKQDEQDRAYIAQILEGDDSFDDRLNDSLSDNENELRENINQSNLTNRLEKMRELFGLEDDESNTEKPKENNKANQMGTHSQKLAVWRYEKYIQLHKYSLIAAEMTFERRQINRRLFLELFGEDSDEEHEAEYSSTEKYRLNCTERISSWVVKYLMPFYHNKRILGRDVFKTLGHYISNAIVDKIQYPDEWTVKYFVSKFFPPKKKYACDVDILNFQLD